MSDFVDSIVIGGGVIGLTCARRLAMDGRDVIVLEQHDSPGTETSSRNSEVIHAGIYYPQQYLKTSLCVKGKTALYRYCEERGVEHKNTGKLIVATSQAETGLLDKYKQQATENGVTDLVFKSVAEIGEMEPAITAVKGLYSPSSGIINIHEYMLALQGDLEHANGLLVCHSRVTGLKPGSRGFIVQIEGEDQFEVECANVINSAGLHAWDVAKFPGPSEHIPERHYAKGHYYTLSGKAPFSRLIYPVAEQGGLGVHVTLDMAGQARFGPDVSWVNELDYRFDKDNQQRFVDAIRKYYPAIDEGKLQASYTGIRPKISGKGMPAGDFLIQTAEQHGHAGLINLFGIESPGLTASLAIADEVLANIKMN